MNSWKLLLLQLLIIGLMTSGLSAPSEDAKLSDSDYQQDGEGDDDYDDDVSDSVQKQGNINSNSVDTNVNTAAAFFKLSDYTETVRIGETVTLRCDVENFAAHNVVLWNVQGKPLFVGNQRSTIDDRFIVSVKDHSLTITNVQESDQNVYSCQLFPNKMNMTAKLVVLSNLQAHIIVGERDVSGRSITYRQNDRIQIECKASGAKNDIVFKWSAGGNRLESNDNLKINGGILTIEKASHDDVRVYQCLADDGADGTAHAVVTINIQYTPRVSALRSVINTKDGDNAELYCDYDSSIESQVIWSKNQQILQTGASHEKRSKYIILPPKTSPTSQNQMQSILVVNDVKPQDLGVYECKVENSIGNENVSIDLTDAPEPPKLHQVETDGNSIVTHWHIRSMQPLKEIMLNYRLKGETNWLTEAVIDQSPGHSGIWKIRHKLTLTPGDWHVRVKSKNTNGWSVYSTLEDIPIKGSDTSSANQMVSPSIASYAIKIAALISIYSINWSSRLFG
ncbi:lachesin isoform X2 [Contarinia nasturtii]|uniref:lachesin isoform X2 n=1 Tax=Contarinia nasturtii TaxID=265458 RepID=UPI0012D458EC|nr:lachesin isoform X2 [Contarinia nasturtii]